MTQHDQKHHAGGHGQHHSGGKKGLHKNWVTWVVVGLMLVAMAIYVMSDDESLQPAGPAGPGVPAEGAPADAP
jgi:hypothetical protein